MLLLNIFFANDIALSNSSSFILNKIYSIDETKVQTHKFATNCINNPLVLISEHKKTFEETIINNNNNFCIKYFV